MVFFGNKLFILKAVKRQLYEQCAVYPETKETRID